MIDMTVRDFHSFCKWLENADVGEVLLLQTKDNGSYFLKLVKHEPDNTIGSNEDEI